MRTITRTAPIDQVLRLANKFLSETGEMPKEIHAGPEFLRSLGIDFLNSEGVRTNYGSAQLIEVYGMKVFRHPDMGETVYVK